MKHTRSLLLHNFIAAAQPAFEEVYLVASDGEFRQGSGAWFTPGVGGTLYHSPGIVHAMRSSNTPLLAFWLLPV